MKQRSPLVRGLLAGLGLLSLGLGIVGIFLPLLPTTPFLLLASWLFLHSSRRLHSWLLGHRIFGEYLRNYIEKRTVPLRIKVAALVTMWAGLAVSAYLVGRLPATLGLAVIGAAVSVHILKLKSK